MNIAPPALQFDAAEQEIVNGLLDRLGFEDVRCCETGIPAIAERSAEKSASRAPENSRVLSMDAVARVVRVVVLRASGRTWREITLMTGDIWTVVKGIASRDKVLFRLLNAGEEAYVEEYSKQLEAKVAERTLRPKPRYVIGRVAKDTDGVLRHPETGELLEVEPDSGKLLEFALPKVHKQYKEERAASVGQHNIIYNLTVVPPLVITERPPDLAVDAEDAEGGARRLTM
jgi:hypothetical protein